jgi:hypothetical protein
MAIWTQTCFVVWPVVGFNKRRNRVTGLGPHSDIRNGPCSTLQTFTGRGIRRTTGSRVR